MFAYWYLKDLALDLIENEGVRFVRGRTLVESRVIGAEGANSGSITEKDCDGVRYSKRVLTLLHSGT
jgi:hypothetical protein